MPGFLKFHLKSQPLNNVTKHKPSERGQVLVLVVFSLVALFGITALAVDGGNIYADQRKAQNAADSAAMAGALARIRGENFVGKAYASAANNGYDNNGQTNKIEVYSPPLSGEHVGDIEYIQVIVTSQVDTYFAGIIGRDIITNTASAVSRTKTPEVKEILDGYALIALAPTSECHKNQSFWVQGEATIDITGGGIFVNSNNRECALIEQGSGSIRIRDESPITIVGGASIQKPKLVTPYPPKTGATRIPYPPPFFMPTVSCGKEAEIIYEYELDDKGNMVETATSRTVMNPGSWDGEFPPDDVIQLRSGVYCVDELIVKNGLLTGSAVTITVSGEVDFADSIVQLSAPHTGDNAGLVIYLPIENKSRVRLSGDAEIRGTILAPGSPIVLKGNSSKYGFHSQIIGYTINADGNDNMIIKYMDEQNYDAMSMPELELTE